MSKLWLVIFSYLFFFSKSSSEPIWSTESARALREECVKVVSSENKQLNSETDQFYHLIALCVYPRANLTKPDNSIDPEAVTDFVSALNPGLNTFSKERLTPFAEKCVKEKGINLQENIIKFFDCFYSKVF